MKKTTQNADETKALAVELLRQYSAVKYWLLYGELGAGKTTFVKGFASALGLSEIAIKSPTFSLIEEHDSFVHIDLYRLSKPDAAIEAQIEESYELGKYILIEWPERLSQKPANALALYFTHEGEDRRSIEVILPPSL